MMTREEWQDLIRSRTGPGVSAADAARDLSPRRHQSKRPLTEWQRDVQQTARAEGISAAEAAHEISPIYRSEHRMRSPTRSRSSSRGSQDGLTDWQKAVQAVSREQGVDAVEAAQMLSPVWRSRSSSGSSSRGASNTDSSRGASNTNGGYGSSSGVSGRGSSNTGYGSSSGVSGRGSSNTGYGSSSGVSGRGSSNTGYGSSSGSSRSSSGSSSRGASNRADSYASEYRRARDTRLGDFGYQGDVNDGRRTQEILRRDTRNDFGLNKPYTRGASNSARVVDGQITGLSRVDWQDLISKTSAQLGTNAAESAQLLNPYVRSQKETKGLTHQEWTSMISDVSRQRGVSASRAAELLDPYVQGVREKNSQYDVKNVSVTQSPTRRGAQSPTRRGAQSPSRRGAQSPTRRGAQSPRYASRSPPRYVPQSPPRSPRSSQEQSDLLLNDAQSAGISMIETSRWNDLNATRPPSTSYFVAEDIYRIADSLGLDTTNLSRQAVIAQIKESTGSMSPRTQSRVLGNQSPRSQSFLQGLLA